MLEWIFDPRTKNKYSMLKKSTQDRKGWQHWSLESVWAENLTEEGGEEEEGLGIDFLIFCNVLNKN